MGDRLQGRVAIVTAAGSGIGRAIAKRFAAEGAHVVVNDRDGAAAEAVVGEIAAAGGPASTFVADVSSSERVTAMVQETAARHGRLDVLVNNAAAPAFGKVEEMPDELWRAVFAVTLDATFFGLRAAIPVMAAQGGGSIINTASAAGLNGVATLGAYGTAKAGVIASRNGKLMAAPSPLSTLRRESDLPVTIIGLWPPRRSASLRRAAVETARS